MDVGELYASVRIDTGNVARDLGQVKTQLDGVKDAAEAVENKRLKISADDKAVKDAKTATDQLGTSADNAASKSTRIKFPTQYTADADRARTAIDGAVDSLGKLAWNAGKWGAATAATTAIAGLGTSLTKGWGRLTAIDTAEAKLEALGNSGRDVNTVMDNALASVKGTAFGIGEAAGTAATMVASGIKPGQELETVLKGVADSAAIAGSGMDEMGLIWGKAAAKGKIDGEIVAQMLERQIPIYDILSQKTGESSDAIAKMVSDGKIDFQTFSEAMNDYVGGGAVRMGDTVKGALDNLGASMGRFGAEGLKGIFQGTPDLLKEATSQFDAATAAVGPFAESIAGKLMPAAEGLVKGIGPGIVASMNMISDLAGATTPAIGGLTSAMQSVPFPMWAGGMMTLVGHHKGWTKKLAEGGGKAKDFGMAVGGVIGQVAENYRNADGVMAGTFANMKSGFSGVKGAAGGLINALGGPWALAMGAAGTAIGILVEKHYEAAQAEIEHRAAQAELKGTLEGTTGAITEQTEELQRKRAEENGWLETATELGLSHNTLIDAMNGNEHAQLRVNQAVAAGTTAAVEASDAWAKNGQHFIDAGIGADTLAAALNGDVDALREVNEAAAGYSTNFGPGMKSMLNEIGHEVGGTTDAFGDLADGVGEASENLADMQVQIAKEELEALQVQAETTKGALELLGDVDLKIEDAGTISLAFDDVSRDTLDKLEEVHNITSRTIDGRVHLSFPDGADILAVLDTMGIKLESLENGTIRVQADDLEGAKALLEELGILANIDGGELFVDTNAQAVIDLLVELGILAADPMTGEVDINADSITDSETKMDRLRETVGEGADGDVRITDNTDQVNKNVNEARANTERGAKGDHRITDNASQVSDNVNRTLQGKTTQGRHIITEERRVSYWTQQGHSPAQARSIQGPVPVSAEGRRVEKRAGGGRLPTTGPGTERTDGILGVDSYSGMPTSWVNKGEWVVNNRRSEKFDSTLAAINGGTRDQIIRNLFRDLDKLETGGVAGRIKSDLAYMDGTPYVFGGWSPAGVDCSGAVSLVANAATGRDPWEARTSTHTMGEFLAARGFVPGQGGPGTLRVGWKNGGPGGGHTALTLPDGTNIESGGNTGQGFTIGGRAAGGSDGQFTDFMHLPLGDQGGWADGDFGDAYTGSGVGGGGYGSRYTGSGGGSGVSMTVNGGHGTMLKDGSALELAAAAYSLYTGQPLGNDITSWGQLMGLGTTYEGENLDRQIRDAEREERKLARSYDGQLRDIEQAKADLKKQQDELAKGGTGEGDKFKAFTDEERAERERRILDQQDRIADLEDSLIDIRDSQRELKESQDKLRVAIERAANAPESFGQAIGITPMATGGILGAARQAQISNGTSAVLWAEDGPEAYIPLSSDKRARSIDIWMETGKRLGMTGMGMLSLLLSGIPGLMEGRLDGFSTGGSASLEALGLNTGAVGHRAGQELGNAIGAVFNGPVQINDPRQYLQSQLGNAQSQLGNAMRSVMIR